MRQSHCFHFHCCTIATTPLDPDHENKELGWLWKSNRRGRPGPNNGHSRGRGTGSQLMLRWAGAPLRPPTPHHPPTGGRRQKKSIGHQPRAAGGQGGPGVRRAAAKPRGVLRWCWPSRRRRNIPEIAILKREQWNIYFWTLSRRGRPLWRLPDAEPSSAGRGGTPLCRIRTLTRNPFVNAADIRHLNPLRILQAIHRSFWIGTSRLGQDRSSCLWFLKLSKLGSWSYHFTAN